MQNTNVNYQKHLNTFVIVLATLVGVSVGVLQFFYQTTKEWYQEGGKEELLQIAYVSREIVVSFYQWVMNEFVPAIVQMYQGIRYNLVLLGVLMPVKKSSTTP